MLQRLHGWEAERTCVGSGEHGLNGLPSPRLVSQCLSLMNQVGQSVLGLSTALPGHTAVFLLGVLSWEPPQGALLASAQLSPAQEGPPLLGVCRQRLGGGVV